MSSSDAVAWFEIHVNDIARMRAFYAQVFGWTYAELPGFPLGEYSMIVAGDGDPPLGGLAQSARRPPPAGESTVVYLLVDDIDGTLDAAAAAGGTVHRPKMNIGGEHGYCAIFQDPEGNHVGLWADH
ncbi:VOC family protein [Nonomuraea sp. NPDC047897]|uniref:VOC family protein n=1 Tax=Nonomuraea sp. NPDC047897 TaxID=3364346 RepID=UPI003717E681